jgi:hypothetical protein
MSGYVASRPGPSNVPVPEEHDLWARHILVRFLQGLFNQLPLDADYHWEPDLQTTKIVITGGTPLDYGAVSPRPAIAVDVGPYRPGNIALDQLRTGNLLTGERLHTDLVSGNALVYVISKVPDEARRLAGWVQRQIRYHRRIMQKVGGFHQIGQQLPVAPPTSPGQIVHGSPSAELVMSTVTVPWHMQWTWYAKPMASEGQVTLDYLLQKARARDYEAPPLQRMEHLTTEFSAENEDDLQVSGMEQGPEPQE